MKNTFFARNLNNDNREEEMVMVMSSNSGLYLTFLSPILFIVIVGGDLLISNTGLKWWHVLVIVFCLAMSLVGVWNVKNDDR